MAHSRILKTDPLKAAKKIEARRENGTFNPKTSFGKLETTFLGALTIITLSRIFGVENYSGADRPGDSCCGTDDNSFRKQAERSFGEDQVR